MAAFKSLLLPFAILTIWVALCSFQTSAILVGGWQPIKNLTDPLVVKIARFAVAEHNKEPKVTKVDFVQVIKGEIQVVAGLNYKLVISARISGINTLKTDDYLAVVYEKLEDKVLKLISFKLLHEN